MERWLVNPYPGQTGILSPKEAILMVQRLAALEKLNLFDAPAGSSSGQQGAGAQQGQGAGGAGGSGSGGSSLKKAWDSTLLSLVLRLSTPPPEAQVGAGKHGLAVAVDFLSPVPRIRIPTAARKLTGPFAGPSSTRPWLGQGRAVKRLGCSPGVAAPGATPSEHLIHSNCM